MKPARPFSCRDQICPKGAVAWFNRPNFQNLLENLSHIELYIQQMENYLDALEGRK